MKRQLTIFFSGYLLLNVFFLTTSFTGTSIKKNTNTTNLLECRWEAELCSDGHTKRDVCVIDGDGDRCTCGAVTTLCP